MKNLRGKMILTCAALMLSASGALALPPCVGRYSIETWTDCSGQHTFEEDYFPTFFKDGKKYEGYFEAGGTYSGDWGYGLPNGQGTFIFASGEKYVGGFKYDNYHGQGTVTYVDGTVEEGVWENHVFKYARKTPYSSEPSLLQVAFNQLSQFHRKKIQLTLSKFGFYSSSVDGIYGKGTAAALTAYNKQYLNGADLTKADNTGKLVKTLLTFEDDKPEPPVVAEMKPQDNKVLEASSGSGFAVSSDGYVITNNHVIEGCAEVVVHDKGQAVPVTVITYDPQNDLALLKGNFTPKTVFALSGDQPELLQDVYVAGYPFGNEISSSIKVTKGIISSLTGVGNNFSNIQIDAALQVGNSGGPILDEMGNVVGVAVSKLDAKYMYDNYGTIPEDTNFGIKANVVKNILDSNGVSSPSPSLSEITKLELGAMITGGTYYVSCWMTLAQIEELRTKKVMFENLD